MPRAYYLISPAANHERYTAKCNTRPHGLAIQHMSAPARLLVDGSEGEAGGQILRNAVTYGAALGRHVAVINIRAGRPKPGLKNQHLQACRYAATLGNASLLGDEIGSATLELQPETPWAAPEHIPQPNDCGGGATGLLAQVALPLVAFRLPCGAEASIAMQGGTHQTMAPPVEAYQAVLFPVLHRVLHGQLKLEATVRKIGLAPRGGGQVVYRCARSPAAATGAAPSAATFVERGTCVCSMEVRAWHMSCPDVLPLIKAELTRALPHVLHAAQQSLAGKPSASDSVSGLQPEETEHGWQIGTVPCAFHATDVPAGSPGIAAGVCIAVRSNTGALWGGDDLWTPAFGARAASRDAEADAAYERGSPAAASSAASASLPVHFPAHGRASRRLPCGKLLAQIAAACVASASNRVVRSVQRGGVVDEACADQLVVWLVLAAWAWKQSSTVLLPPLTPHAASALSVAANIVGDCVQVSAVRQPNGAVLVHTQPGRCSADAAELLLGLATGSSVH